MRTLIEDLLTYARVDSRGAELVPVSMDKTFADTDNGIGIPAERREEVFEIFRRLHDDRHYPGTGIGLAVCRRVVERHGGRIWIEDAPSGGSTFCFTLRALD